MIPAMLFVILAVVAFVVLVWNQLLPISGAQSKQFVEFIMDIFRHSYENQAIVQQYIDKPILTPIKEEIGAMVNNTNQRRTYFAGPLVFDSLEGANVTLTFYVEYGNNQYLPDLLDLLYKYKIDKAVFFLEKNYSQENPFMVQRLQYNGYIVRDWQTIGEYDKDYSPTIFDGVILADKEILAIAKNDRDASSFLQTAISYHGSSIIAFTPKIMAHKLLLQTLLNHNGKDITFTENNGTSTKNYDMESGITTYTFNKNTDPVLQYLQIENIRETKISAGEWTMRSLADEFPSTVRFLSDKNAFLIMRPMLVDNNASLDLTNQNIMLLSNQETDFPSTFLEIKGIAKTGNTTISSYDPIVNKPDPNGYHPRPFVLVRDGGIMNLSNSTISYLGYSSGGFENTKISKPAITYYNTTNVEIENSALKNNYYGFYSDNTNNISIVGNHIFDNTRNGFDSHNAINLYVSENHIYNNGDRGFICSLNCTNVTIANNIVEHNGAGIGLHWLTTNSVIKDNIVRYNEKFGIFIENGSHNIVINNTVIGNEYGIGLIHGSSENKVMQNTLAGNIFEQIIVESDSQSNIEIDNKVYSSKDQR